MSKLDEINNQLLTLNREQQRLKQEEFDKAVAPLLKNAIGSCWAYRRNSYSCHQPHQRWDVFRKVMDVMVSPGSVVLVTTEVSIDYHGKVTLYADVQYVFQRNPISLMTEGWQRCKALEFNKTYRLALRQLEKPTLLQERKDID